jgi:hypothetical protein
MSPAPPSGPPGAHAVDVHRLAGRVFFWAVVSEALLVVGDYVFEHHRWIDDLSVRRLFNLAREETIPSWFSSTQAFLVGLTAFAVAWVVGRRGAGRWTRIGWVLIGLFFVFTSMDDASKFHEKVGSALERALEARRTSGSAGLLDTYPWHLFVLPLYVAGGLLVFLVAWRHLRAHGLFGYVLAGLLLLATAVAFDWIEGLEDERGETGRVLNAMADAHGVARGTFSHFWKVAEEAIEMLGTTVCWYAFLRALGVFADGLAVVCRRETA